MPSVPTISLELLPEPPADWRERILRALAGEGVTEPRYVPVWRLVLFNFGKVVGWVLLSFAGTFGLIAAAPFVSRKELAVLAIVWLIVTPLSWIKFFMPRLRMAGLKSRVEFAGRNPTHAIMMARRPPIFYLRAFSFDEVASAAPSKWLVSPTPEMTLILRMRRYAPVLAIGKPDEVNPPPGAMRFHVTDAHWELAVKSIVPCCQLVVWVTGNTRGLNWEIEHLIGSLPPHRLLLWPHVNVEVANKLKIDWVSTVEQRNVEWQRFVDLHCDVFPKPLPRDVKDIRSIAFDADWTPVPIPSGRYPARPMDRLTDPNGIITGLSSFLEESFRVKSPTTRRMP